MKKVLFVATVSSHINSFHLPYLKLFKDNNWETHVVSGDNNRIKDYCDKKHQICILRNPFNLKNIKAIIQLKKIIEKEQFDIIHCHTPMGGVITRIAGRKFRKKGTKIIYTAHGFHFFKGAPLKNWLLYYPVEKYLAKYTDTLITINKEDFNLAKKKFNKRCKNIKYIPGVGININKFNTKMTEQEKNNLRKSLGIRNDDFIMFFPARLDKNKNQGFLISVMEKIIKEKKKENVHLLLAGRDELNGYYQSIVKEKKLESKIHFLGYRTDIPELLKISNIAVSSSLREGLPVNIMEALASGVPVVSLGCRGMSDIIIEGKNGYIISNFNDHDTFISSILKILSNDKSIMNEKEIRNTSKKYEIDKIINEYKKIYF